MLRNEVMCVCCKEKWNVILFETTFFMIGFSLYKRVSYNYIRDPCMFGWLERWCDDENQWYDWIILWYTNTTNQKDIHSCLILGFGYQVTLPFHPGVMFRFGFSLHCKCPYMDKELGYWKIKCACRYNYDGTTHKLSYEPTPIMTLHVHPTMPMEVWKLACFRIKVSWNTIVLMNTLNLIYFKNSMRISFVNK